jgi:protein phosphatase PTC7
MNSKFSYGIAASFNAKNMEFNPLANFFNFDPYAPIIKKREDKRTRPGSGQDAFFISRVGKSGDVAFGVADGVGGWDDINIDLADFSHQLCDYMAYAAYLSEAAGSALSVRALMQEGYDALVQDPSIIAGGSVSHAADRYV